MRRLMHKHGASQYEIMLDLIANGAANGPQTAYLSDAYRWLKKMVDDMGLTQKAVDNYMKCYNNQWPNVVEINSMEYDPMRSPICRSRILRSASNHHGTD
jgi:hypothetical protein